MIGWIRKNNRAARATRTQISRGIARARPNFLCVLFLQRTYFKFRQYRFLVNYLFSCSFTIYTFCSTLSTGLPVNKQTNKRCRKLFLLRSVNYLQRKTEGYSYLRNQCKPQLVAWRENKDGKKGTVKIFCTSKRQLIDMKYRQNH